HLGPRGCRGRRGGWRSAACRGRIRIRRAPDREAGRGGPRGPHSAALEDHPPDAMAGGGRGTALPFAGCGYRGGRARVGANAAVDQRSLPATPRPRGPRHGPDASPQSGGGDDQGLPGTHRRRPTIGDGRRVRLTTEVSVVGVVVSARRARGPGAVIVAAAGSVGARASRAATTILGGRRLGLARAADASALVVVVG